MQVSGKASVAFGKALRKIIFTFCNLPKKNRVVKPKCYQVILR